MLDDLPKLPTYEEQWKLARRFRATVPLKRLLLVRYCHVQRPWEVYEVLGYPVAVRDLMSRVIYVRNLGGDLVPVAIACLLSIERFELRGESPEKGQGKEFPMPTQP